ncbi:MAG: glycosyltransferase family 39 protein [Verrucomicrobiota bacterium]
MELTFTQRLLVQSLAVLTLLRWVVAGLHDISPAEAQLVETLRHPALAGLHGGNLTAWLAGISSFIFGHTPLGVRFAAPLFIAGSSWMLYRLAHSLTGEKTAGWAVALFNLAPITNLAAVQMRPETPGLFFLIAGLVAVWRGLRRASPWDWHWPLAGMLFGLGFLCWYGAVWGIAGALLLLTGSRRWRGFLRRPGPWLMVADFALFAWPVWEWNRSHAWAGYYFWRDALRPPGQPWSWSGPLTQAGQWLAAVSPVMFAAMLWALFQAVRQWRASDAARFITAVSLPPLAAAWLATLSAGPHPEWLAPAFPALCLLLPWAWENHLPDLRGKIRLQWLCVLPALVCAPLVLDTDLLRHAGAPVTYRHDKSRNWRGWRTLAAEAAEVIRSAAPQAPGGLFVIAQDERLASVLNFHLPPDLPVLRPTPRHPLVMALSCPVPESDYHFWPGYLGTAEGKSAFMGRTALYFTTSTADNPPRRLRAAFRDIQPLTVFDVMQRGLPLRRIKVFACHEYLEAGGGGGR